VELILFIGLQGSGKSSFYRERFAGTHVLVSKDLWPHARRREARQRRLISEALAAGRSEGFDALFFVRFTPEGTFDVTDGREP